MIDAESFSQVYKEAQFYQIRSLIDKLERNAQIFALKLDEAKKSKLGNSFTKWKNTVVSTAQLKSLTNLSSLSTINMISIEDHLSLLDKCDCLGEMEHSIVNEIDKNSESKDQGFDSSPKRLISPDILIDIPQSDMGMFVRILREELTREAYSFRMWTRELRCSNVKKIMNVCVEKCEFRLNEYYVEFEWLLAKEARPPENNDLCRPIGK